LVSLAISLSARLFSIFFFILGFHFWCHISTRCDGKCTDYPQSILKPLIIHGILISREQGGGGGWWCYFVLLLYW
jgi:hypothetical protein